MTDKKLDRFLTNTTIVLGIICAVMWAMVVVARSQTFASPPFVFQPDTPANASQMMANYQTFVNNGNAVSADLASRIAAKQPFPSGTVAFFHLSVCPATWTLQSSYVNRFVRGLDLGRGQDPGNTLGQLKSSQNQGHKHSITSPLGATGVTTIGGANDLGAVVLFSTQLSSGGTLAVDSGIHGSVMRPDNTTLLLCRKN